MSTLARRFTIIGLIALNFALGFSAAVDHAHQDLRFAGVTQSIR